MNLGDVKKEMMFGIGGGYNLPLNEFWKAENEKLERAFLNFAREESKQNEGEN